MTDRSAAALQKLASFQLKPVNSGLLQRQCACGNHATGGECASCKGKKRLGLQTKLKINDPETPMSKKQTR